MLNPILVPLQLLDDFWNVTLRRKEEPSIHNGFHFHEREGTHHGIENTQVNFVEAAYARILKSDFLIYDQIGWTYGQPMNDIPLISTAIHSSFEMLKRNGI
ncbi:hypothetical protein GCM10023156_05000 [Novipirellula rosea]|uniref:Uncharacterized protein n=1 Tax=Novipirellula rosea TaxID=1031540 RepID=A0ABP8M7J5_9BACT